jgi:GTP-binding protein
MLRREGFELAVSRPQVIYREVEGKMCEPFESVTIDTPDEFSGAVIDSLAQRKAEMQNMETNANGQTRLTFSAPTRGLIGYDSQFLSMTRGYGIFNHTFSEYKPVIKNWEPGRRNGALVSINRGKATTYAIMGVEDRGTIFVDPGAEVYEGMIVGQSSRERDISVNVTKGKNMTNVRSSNKDQTATIKKPTHLTLEESLEFLNEDELLEITPKSIRLRKRILETNMREKAAKQKKTAARKNA